MRAPWACLGILIAGGCADDRALFLSTDGFAAIVLMQLAGTAVEVEAVAVTADAPIERSAPAANTLFVVGYRAPLEVLGLAAGPLALAPSGEALPPGDRFYRLGEDAWETLDVPPDVLGRVHLAVEDACATFEVSSRALALGADELVTFALSIDDESVMLATNEGRFFRVTADGMERLVELSTRTPALAGFRAADGELWLGGRDGRVVHGRLGAPLVEAPPLPLDPRERLVLDGARGDAPFELFAVDGDLSVAHFDGVRWTRVREGGPPVVSTLLRPDLAWAERGRAVLTGIGTSSIAELTSTGGERRINLDFPPRASRDAPWAVEYVEGRGAVVGTHYDVLYVRDQGVFRRLVEPPFTPRADVIVDLGERAVLAGGQNGNFAQLRAGDDFCDPIRLMTGPFAYVAARLGRGLVLVAGENEATARVHTVTRGR